MTRRKRYSAEFKREALRRANEEGVTDRCALKHVQKRGSPHRLTYAPEIFECLLSGIGCIVSLGS
jgi:transposase-like protein